MTHDVLELMVRKLGTHAALTDADRQALAGLPHTIRTYEAGTFLAREGEAANEHIVLLSGYTFRHKTTCFGGRQIVSMQLPGETIACSSLFFDATDHSTQALTAIRAAVIPRLAFRDLVRSSAAISHALLMMALIEAAIGNEWLLNIGRREAKARVAHFLCEFAARVDAAGLATGEQYELPFTQEQMGDALGLTSVHVNRTLKALRESEFIEQIGRKMSFPDRKALARVADFSGDYLRVDQPRGK